jgi:hypothetical protein
MAQSKKNPCPFCGRLYVNLSRHLVCPARDKAMAQRALDLEAAMKAPKGQKEGVVLVVAHSYTKYEFERAPGLEVQASKELVLGQEMAKAIPIQRLQKEQEERKAKWVKKNLQMTPKAEEEARRRLAAQARALDEGISAQVKEAREEHLARIRAGEGIDGVMKEWKGYLIHLAHATCDDEAWLIRCKIEEVQARAEAYGKALRKKIVPPQITGRDRAEFAQARKALPWYEMKA